MLAIEIKLSHPQGGVHMRMIRTISLRLLIDSDEPDDWRGTIRDAAGADEHTFVGVQALVSWLHAMTRVDPGLPASTTRPSPQGLDQEESR